MFKPEVYTARRNKLRSKLESGLVLLLGNQESPMNYPDNAYAFRQDSSFLYFFGINLPEMVGVLDMDSNEDYIFGEDISIGHIIWMGKQPTVVENAAQVGVKNTANLATLHEMIAEAVQLGRKIHILPPYRTENQLYLSELLEVPYADVSKHVSEDLIKAVVALRSVKDQYEVAEMEKTLTEVTWHMHVDAMKKAREGTYEREIAGHIEGLSIAGGGRVAYPVILTKNGQTLHNHYHGNLLKNNDLLLNDAGAESPSGYATDITRTVPVGGKFSRKQKEIYEIVLQAEETVIQQLKPDINYQSMHLLAAKIIVDGLKKLGLMKGDTEQAVQQAAYALFMPHGLGHMIGLDVHDMEDLGEDYVGYDAETTRSTQFGFGFLRLGRKLKTGFVLTVEPGIYFIPDLIKLWKEEGKFTEFIDYQKVEEYIGFGGIRIEDNILITETGHRVLGKPIPKTVEEIEKIMAV